MVDQNQFFISLLGLDQPERHPGRLLIEYSQTDRLPRESVVGSADQMVLHRPSEPARITGQLL
jgi:hypothetical protein